MAEFYVGRQVIRKTNEIVKFYELSAIEMQRKLVVGQVAKTLLLI